MTACLTTEAICKRLNSHFSKSPHLQKEESLLECFVVVHHRLQHVSNGNQAPEVSYQGNPLERCTAAAQQEAKLNKRYLETKNVETEKKAQHGVNTNATTLWNI